ncbi:MAG: branched-chain amino acid aminotransferase, partial [Actinobacteria bacterium]|nr:branched-chain amino acid aminotransferase [Actinomycetota bacterium]
MKLLVNGKVVSEPLTLPFSLSYIRGDGLFETILGIDEKIIAWQRHYERLAKSAEKVLITIPAKIDIEIGINQLLKGVIGKSRIRVAVLAVAVEAAEGLDKLPSLIKMNQVINSNSPLSGIKSISYGQSMLAVRTAHARGYSDGVYLNENGDVVETGSANIIILKDGKFITPALESGCLPGITRQILIKDFAVTEELFTWDQLLQADAVFLCSSIRLLTPVSKVEDKLFEGSEIGAKLIGEFEQHIRS